MTARTQRRAPRSTAWTGAVLRSAQVAYLAFLVLSAGLLASALATGAEVRTVCGLAVQAALWAALLLADLTEPRRGAAHRDRRV
ncbi:hypothetical protein [Streptomyces sp. SID10815]|uniref:Sensor histidine kinase n=1 Tax=Streptomyces similanensis TaxID=1274988 RepID=A0ABP9K9C6_9ACTN|nr:hypothetical protein [Streptomyces sp. SID10815]NEA45071.1 hypothetical protein [Streptomyces sp. SID10815]QKW25178.1 hypothetical protein HUT11_02845 [Streptomyces seoulensis]